MNLEYDLRQALKRKAPPHGFGERVLNRIASTAVDVPRTPTSWHRGALPVAASLMLLAGGSYFVHQHNARQSEERQSQYRQNAQAAHDVVLALQIASEKVSAVQAKVQEMTRHEPHNDY